MDNVLRRRPLLRFSVATLLFLMLCVGGYLGGYRTGFDSGKQAAEDAETFPMVYPVSDLLTPATRGATAADYDSIVNAIVEKASPNSWLENGTGLGEIHPYPSKQCIVILQNRAVHEKISALLETMRRSQPKVVTTTAK